MNLVVVSIVLEVTDCVLPVCSQDILVLARESLMGLSLRMLDMILRAHRRV